MKAPNGRIQISNPGNGRKPLAQARRPGARGALCGRGMAGRRPLRGGALVRQRPRDQRFARRRKVDRPAGLGPIRHARRCPADSRILEEYEVKACFYAPAVTALLHADEQRRVVAEGHEIGIHGWIHELNSVLPYEVERDLMLRAAETLEKISGMRPVGLRTPSWDFSQIRSRSRRRWGLLYDSSLMADEDCYELLLDGEPTGIVELPVEWIRDDAVYFMMHRF